MTSQEHLQHLVELRGALLREVARLDVEICNERTHAQGSRPSLDSGHHRGGDLSWEAALREAKIRRWDESLAMHA
jgi:hypothetical protein